MYAQTPFRSITGTKDVRIEADRSRGGKRGPTCLGREGEEATIIGASVSEPHTIVCSISTFVHPVVDVGDRRPSWLL